MNKATRQSSRQRKKTTKVVNQEMASRAPQKALEDENTDQDKAERNS